MNQIKYKVWDKKGEFWITESEDIWINQKGGVFREVQAVHGEPFRQYISSSTVEVIFYTGLKDINGKEVYGKDIYKNYENGCIGVLSNDGYGLWTTEYKNGVIYNNLPFRSLDLTNFEVIGNLLEKPNLLNQCR